MPKRAQAYVSEQSIAERCEYWLAEIRNQVAPRPQLKIKASKCALLVIDMLYYFIHPRGRCFLSAAPAIVPRIKQLLTFWRDINGYVIYTRHCHQSTHDLGMLGKFYSDYIHCQEPEANLIETLQPQSNETILSKTTYDAFWNTELDKQLHKAGMKQVLITGVLTHLCCETTARSAFCRDYEVYMVADATASSTETLHCNALLGLADGVAKVMSTSEVIEKCQSSTSLL